MKRYNYNIKVVKAENTKSGEVVKVIFKILLFFKLKHTYIIKDDGIYADYGFNKVEKLKNEDLIEAIEYKLKRFKKNRFDYA